MAQGTPFLICIALMIILGSYLAIHFNGGKVFVGIGIGAQIIGFTSLLMGRTPIRIKNDEKFKEIFERLDKRSEPDIDGALLLGKTVLGIWLILSGLAVQLIGLFLM